MNRDLIWLAVVLVVAFAPVAANYYEEDTEVWIVEPEDDAEYQGEDLEPAIEWMEA